MIRNVNYFIICSCGYCRISSVGRVAPLHGEGRRFEPYIRHHLFIWGSYANGRGCGCEPQDRGSIPLLPTKYCVSSVGRTEGHRFNHPYTQYHSPHSREVKTPLSQGGNMSSILIAETSCRYEVIRDETQK